MSRFSLKLQSRPLYYFPVYMFVVGLYILIQGILNDHTFSSETTHYYGPKAGTVIHNYDFHLSIGAGAGFIITALVTFYFFYKGKRTYLKSVDREIAKSNPWHELTIITDTHVRQEKKNSAVEIHWPEFEFYQIYDRYITLYVTGQYPKIIIDRDLLSQDQETELVNFLSTVVRFKKNKRFLNLV